MILIFGGTTEGRLAVDVCEKAGRPFYYSTKGSMQEVEMHNGVRLAGAMTTDDILAFCEKNGIRCIIDAAHPFAANLHSTIDATGMPVIRLQRRFCDRMQGVVYCKDYDDAIAKMEDEDIHCLLALSGVNTISKLKGYWQHHRTIFRILQREDSIAITLRNALPTKNILFYPNDCALPTKEEEMMVMKNVGCDAIITKDSGESGGFTEKVEAALALGIKVFVVEHPQLPERWTYVTGKHGLRRAIEHHVPEFFPLKTGYTTGACATAAAKAALLSLLYNEQPEEIAFSLPDGELMTIPVFIRDRGVAVVEKDFSDDPDVTKGCEIMVEVRENPLSNSPEGEDGKLQFDKEKDGIKQRGLIRFLQGKGVGTATLPGLGIPVGEPAINPTPRRMIEEEFRAISDGGFDVTISVENGEEIARKTFNPKVGVIGGISIIGTSGIVYPLSNEAFIESIRREIEVAAAIKCGEIALVSGKKGEDVLKHESSIRCIHYGNFIGEALKAAYELAIPKVTVAIMIGKAVKLAEGHLDTHSHKVQMNKDFLKSLAPEYSEQIESITLARELWTFMPPSFFEDIRQKCHEHCRSVFPEGELKIRIICDDQV